MQNVSMRQLVPAEIGLLETNGCQCSDWRKILVKGSIDPSCIRNVDFFGKVILENIDGRIIPAGNKQYKSGLKNSSITDSSIGEGSCVINVDHLINTNLGAGCILDRIHELSATPYIPFFRIQVSNENGKRLSPVFPGFFEQLEPLLENHSAMDFLEKQIPTQSSNDIGKGCVIRNSGILINICCGEGTIIHNLAFADKIWIEGKKISPVQIDGASSLERGIISEGATIGYLVLAKDFFCGSHSNISEGARIQHTILGANSTIAGAEVQNSLLGPFHEQHHSSSFLIAATINGQSNMAAGAVLGSNHNSRRNDGELLAGRGFWPGLCVSLKHSSRFAAFSMISKGDYSREINNPFPFSLIYREEQTGQLVIYPAFWFIYNMYALERNWQKFQSRDRRAEKSINYYYHYLGPDTATEMINAIEWLQTTSSGNREFITLSGLEEGNREVMVRKPDKAISVYRDMLFYYSMNMMAINNANGKIGEKQIQPWITKGGIPVPAGEWGQLYEQAGGDLKLSITDVSIQYLKFQSRLPRLELNYAQSLVYQLTGKLLVEMKKEEIKNLKDQYMRVNEWISDEVKKSRLKDFQDPIRSALYHSEEEKRNILGTFENDPFILETEKRLHDERLAVGVFLDKQMDAK